MRRLVESFEDIQQQEFAHLTGEIGALGRRLVELGLVELGWSRDQVLAYVKALLTESMDPASGDTNANRKEW